jgi:hypothetical protein
MQHGLNYPGILMDALISYTGRRLSMTTDRWYRGRDGTYHWVSCWFIGACGHLCFTGPMKTSDELSTADMCPDCLSRFFDHTIPMPGTHHQGVPA